MSNRYDFVSYSLVMFFSFLAVILFPDFFLGNRADKESVVLACKILIVFPSLFLGYKIYSLYQKGSK